ncbi:Uncharacterised protein [Nocardia otitidiscaviarum]|uniref:Uncharacterized protein n=1 Tax=Nocardia otitidiscaviarum TaxID=1823 RepID=A0A378Y835_9NOCA|nr:hypothetical protein [Nocardia otitidiscaviarum]SUA72903.1 Uncharacterised protein [Nocardia otitidiscaviarum]
MRENGFAAALLGYLSDLTETIARRIDRIVIARTLALDEAGAPDGLYRDRFGALWEKHARGWRLWLRSGAALEVLATEADIARTLRSFAPFTPVVVWLPRR